ncbi:MAG: hypothetical protein WC992_07650 [Acholeplasmataceae bacterium]|jgi:hypothetical protein|nr:hypothetical protein [Acholeplasmataceae bacterium]
MKQLIKATIMFIASLTLLTAVVYAWFSNSNESNIQPINAQMMERNLDLDIEFGINGGGYESFEDPADINAYLSSMQAGDQINIRVVILNQNSESAPDMNLSIVLYNIRATETTSLYDLTDFFYLVDGTIDLTRYASLSDYYVDNSYQSIPVLINQIDENVIDYLGVPLESYRLSNVFNHYMDGEELVVHNNIDIMETMLPSQELVVVEFSIGLDAYAPDDILGIQDGELLIDGLYTLYDE